MVIFLVQGRGGGGSLKFEMINIHCFYGGGGYVQVIPCLNHFLKIFLNKSKRIMTKDKSTKVLFKVVHSIGLPNQAAYVKTQ